MALVPERALHPAPSQVSRANNTEKSLFVSSGAEAGLGCGTIAGTFAGAGVGADMSGDGAGP